MMESWFLLIALILTCACHGSSMSSSEASAMKILTLVDDYLNQLERSRSSSSSIVGTSHSSYYRPLVTIGYAQTLDGSM